MNEKIKLIITKAELGLLYLAICELSDKRAGKEIDRNDLLQNQIIEMKSKIEELEKRI